MGRDQGEDPGRPEAAHRKTDAAAAADHAGNPGSLIPAEGRYLEDASGLRGHADGLWIPEDASAVQAIQREASARGIAVTAAGAGTGVTGGAVPFGGWVLSLEKFRKLEVHAGYADVGAGVLLRDLQAAALATGQLYPPDPTETGASIGGNIASNSSGSRSFRYGSTRSWVQALTVVLADGTLHRFERGQPIDFDVAEIPQPEVTKNTAGYPLRAGMDWVDLFVGSEGTLGVVLEARVKLLKAPEDVLAGVIFFASDDAALNAVEAWRGDAGSRMLEYMDHRSLDMLRTRYSEIPAAAKAALMIEAEDADVDKWIDRLDAAGALEESWFGTSPADRERFRKFRHVLPELVNDRVRRGGAMKMNTDHAVPLTRNREMLAYYHERLEAEFPDRYVLFGHIGDAHVHLNLFTSPEEKDRATALLTEFAKKAVELGGTVSAEHGLGKRKSHLLPLQYTEEQIEAMRAVKRRLDPGGVLGRGTLWG